MNTPLVSIACTTYNHENYIRDAIEGFLMQITNFTIEILIFDDASNDKTQEIINEYASKNENIVTYLQKENQWSQGKYGVLEWIFPAARGKYIALCEGDDYWTDPYKLQKQVDWLEGNEQYIVCTHNHSTLYCERNELTNEPKYNHSFEYDLNLYFENQVTQTLTSCFRNIFRDYNYLARENILTDFFLFFELLKHGKGYFMVDNMATYRVHNKGVCSGLSEEQKILNHIIMFKHLYKYNSWITQIRPQIARYYLIHFNYTLRVDKKKCPVWSDVRNYYKYEPIFTKLIAASLFNIPFYLFRYWIPNILSFKIHK